MEGATAMDGALGAKNAAYWGDIIAEAAINLTLFYMPKIVLLAPHILDDQTKRRDDEVEGIL